MTIQLKIVYKKTEDLIPYARNSRTHDEAQVAQIAASIKEFGFTNPILLDGENGIIADNKLALNSGWDNEMLQLEMETLQDAGYGIDVLGFDDKDLKALFGNLVDANDEVNEPVDESRNLLMIECEGERELETLFEEMQKRGFQCKILS